MTKRKHTSSPGELETALDSIRPDGSSDRPISPDDIPAMLELAIERVHRAQAEMHRTIELATSQLLHEAQKSNALAEHARAMAQQSTEPPDPGTTEPPDPSASGSGSGRSER